MEKNKITNTEQLKEKSISFTAKVGLNFNSNKIEKCKVKLSSESITINISKNQYEFFYKNIIHFGISKEINQILIVYPISEVDIKQEFNLKMKEDSEEMVIEIYPDNKNKVSLYYDCMKEFNSKVVSEEFPQDDLIDNELFTSEDLV